MRTGRSARRCCECSSSRSPMVAFPTLTLSMRMLTMIQHRRLAAAPAKSDEAGLVSRRGDCRYSPIPVIQNPAEFQCPNSHGSDGALLSRIQQRRLDEAADAAPWADATVASSSRVASTMGITGGAARTRSLSARPGGRPSCAYATWAHASIDGVNSIGTSHPPCAARSTHQPQRLWRR